MAGPRHGEQKRAETCPTAMFDLNREVKREGIAVS